jgi:hypothetical protein
MHGTPIDADLLLAEAVAAAERESRPPEPITQEQMQRFAREFMAAVRKARS